MASVPGCDQQPARKPYWGVCSRGPSYGVLRTGWTVPLQGTNGEERTMASVPGCDQQPARKPYWGVCSRGPSYGVLRTGWTVPLQGTNGDDRVGPRL